MSNNEEERYHISKSTVTIIQEQTIKCFSTADNEARQPSSLIRVRQPNSHLTDTKTYLEASQHVADKLITTTYLYGLPGSGKSQMVRRLADNFPYRQNMSSELLVKWHIQCKDSGQDIRQELLNLTEDLRRHFLLKDDAEYQDIVKGLSEGVGHPLVSALLKTNVPVLIIIEDPDKQKQRKNLLRDICRCIDKESCKVQSSQLHLYITARLESVIISRIEEASLPSFKKIQVQGFSKEEALSYLVPENNDREAAAKVCARFSGSPLGLQAAKKYRDDAQISFEVYLELLQDCEYEIHQSEREAILNEYGDNAEHVFQALIMPFKPCDNAETSALLRWRVLCCLSYLHYDRIPRYIIEKSVERHRVAPVKSRALNFAESGKIMTVLEEHSMGTISKDKNKITLHEVVTNSFKHSCLTVSDSENICHPLKSALELLASIATRDLRQKETAEKMYRLRPHLQALLDNVETCGVVSDSLMNNLLSSHLCEITAAVMMDESPIFIEKSKEFFRKALEYVWGEEKTKRLMTFVDESSPTAITDAAWFVVTQSEALGSELPSDFLLEYESKLLLCFENIHHNALKRKHCNNYVSIHDEIKSQTSNKSMIKKLRLYGLFLEDRKYQPVFYAERVASILHSWSRLALYVNKNTTEAREYISYRRMSLLSRVISQNCRTSHGVPLLVEQLAAYAIIQISLKQQKDIQSLEDAKKTCKEELTKEYSDTGLYANGLLKKLDGPSHPTTLIYLLMCMVRIHTKLLPLRNNEDSQSLEEGDERCEQLMQLAKESAGKNTHLLECASYTVQSTMQQSGISKDLEFASRLILKSATSLNVSHVLGSIAGRYTIMQD